MQITGRGFIAQNFRSLEGRHRHTLLLASGVSGAGVAEDAAFRQDAQLLYDTLRDCLRDGRQLVYFSTSSGALYGTVHGPAVEDGPVFPRSAYGRHKLAMEEVIAASGVRHLILRLATPAGPGQRPHQFLPALAAQVRAGNVSVHRGARRDLVDIRHVVAAVDELLRRGVTDEVVNVASGWQVPVEDVVTHLEARLGRAVRTYEHRARTDPVIAVGKLRRLAPSVTAMGFGPDYFRTVVDRYVKPSVRLTSGRAG